MSAPSIPIIQPQTWASLSSITFYWAPPSTIGSSPITNYTLLCSTIPYSTVIGPSTHNIQISTLANNVDYVFQIAASNSNGTSPYARFNLAQAGAPAAGASSVTVSTTNVSTVNVSWSYSTNAHEAKAQFFGISILPSTGTTSTVIAVAYANERNKFITNLSTNNYTFLVQAITGAGWAFPHSYSFSPMTFVGSAIIPAAPFVPTVIPGLQVWLDGQDPLATGAAPANGTSVTTWADKSSNSRSFTGSATYNTTTTGLTFNGTSNYYSFSQMPLNYTGSVAYVVNITSPSGWDNLFQLGPDYAGVTFRINGYTGNTVQINTVGGAEQQLAQLPIYSNTLVIFIYTFTGTASSSTSLFIEEIGNGTLTTNTATATRGITPGNQGAYIGTYAALGARFTGVVHEVLYYNSVLTQVTRQTMEGYLAWKWGLQTSLPTSHPYRSAAPTPATAFTPTAIPGLQVWLDGADPLNTGIQPANNATLGTWFDKSGNGYNAINSTGTVQYQTNILNSRGVPYFTSNSSLRSPYTNGTAAPLTAFIVAQSKGGGFSAAIGINAYSGIRPNLLALYQSSTNFWWFSGGTGAVDGNTNTLSLLSTRFDINANYWQPNQTQMNINGTSYASSSAAPSQMTSGATLLIGSTFSGGQNEFWNGYIAEVIIYNGTLSTTNRQIVEGYLAWKWGLQTSLPVAHPYASAPVTLIMPLPLVYLYATTYSGSGTWNDSSGNGRNATLESGVIAKNAAGNGIVLNGGTSWTFPNVGVSNSWSVSAWFKRTSTPTGTGASIVTQIQSGSGGVAFSVWSGGLMAHNGTWYYGSQAPTYTTNIWTHVVFTWDGTNLVTYQDSTSLGTTQLGVALIDGGLGYRIGKSGYNNNYVVGEIGEVRIYNTPLSSAQVVQIYNTTFSTYMPTPLVYLYATTYSGSGTWNDSSPNGKNATLETGAIAKNAAGNGIVLNGSTTWTFSNPALGNAWTVSAWYKNTAAPSSGNPTIVTQRFNSAPMNAILGYYSNSSFDNRFYTGAWFIGSTYTLTNGSWTNIQATWDGTNLSTYINGILLGTVATGGTATDSGQLYRIGGDIGNPGPGAFLRGEIGEVRIYGTPLTSAQVLNLYNATVNAYLPAPLVYLFAKTYSGSGTWNDSSGNGKNATLETGAIAKNAAGNGIVLNGGTSWTFPNIAAGNVWTVSVWYKNTGVPVGNACIVTQRQSGSSAVNFALQPSNVLSFNSLWYYGTAFGLTNNIWTNIQVTWNGANMITYKDGVLVGSTALSFVSVDGNDVYIIGRKWDNFSHVTGEIGEIRIYRANLSPAQVSDLYTSTAATYA